MNRVIKDETFVSFARCAVRDMVLPQATADLIKTRGVTSRVAPSPGDVVVYTSATGGCDVTTSDVTELSANGWLSDKLVGFCVRSVDGATSRRGLIFIEKRTPLNKCRKIANSNT